MNHQSYSAVGRLTRPPRFFPAGMKGKEHATFNLAINRVVPSGEGPGTDYIPCVIWGPEAGVLCRTISKGDEVRIKAKIRTSYVPKGDGNSEFKMEIRLDRIQYGAISLKNLSGMPTQDDTTKAVGRLSKEFGD